MNPRHDHVHPGASDMTERLRLLGDEIDKIVERDGKLLRFLRYLNTIDDVAERLRSLGDEIQVSIGHDGYLQFLDLEAAINDVIERTDGQPQLSIECLWLSDVVSRVFESDGSRGKFNLTHKCVVNNFLSFAFLS